MTIEQAAAAMQRFADTMMRVVDEEARRLADRVAKAAHTEVVGIGWQTYRNGDEEITISLADGTGLTSRGRGRLDALVDLERRLS